MKFRKHRGGYDDSMATTVEIPATIEALRNEVAKIGSDNYHPELSGLRAYGGVDQRNGWDTYIVLGTTPDGVTFPVGFTDGPIDGLTDDAMIPPLGD